MSSDETHVTARLGVESDAAAAAIERDRFDGGWAMRARAIAAQGYGEFARYVAASAVALGIDLTLVYGLTEIVGFHYLTSGAVGFVAGAVVIYLLSVYWVFKTRRMADRRAAEFMIFVVIGVIGLAINEIVLFGMTEYVGTHYMVSKIFAVGLCFAFNFVARKIVLFR